MAGVLGSIVNIAVFGGLAWWVSTEDNAVGYIAAVLFGIMAVLGAIIVFLMIVLDDKSADVRHGDRQAENNGKLDPATMAAAMIVANSDQFYDQDDSANDYVDDDTDIDID